MKCRLLLFFVIISFTACQSIDFEQCIDSQREQPNRKVLILGVDGMKSDALLKAKTPTIDEYFFERGSQTLSAKIDTSKSFSGPGWASILTGVWSEKHLVNSNFFTMKNFQQYQLLSCLLDDAEQEFGVEMTTGWDELSFELDNCSGSRLVLGDDNISDHVLDKLKDCTTDVVFAHFIEVDNRGHNFGFSVDSPEYIDEIESIDHYLRCFLDVVEKREAQLQEEWLLVLCTDHGGVKLDESEQIDRFIGKHKGFGHLPEVSEVPLAFYSSILGGRDISEDVTIVDIMPTVIDWLGVPPKESYGFDGKIIELK